MKQVNKFLAFVCVIRDEIFSENRGIMDYNLTLFKDSVRDILLASQMSNNISLNHDRMFLLYTHQIYVYLNIC